MLTSLCLVPLASLLLLARAADLPQHTKFLKMHTFKKDSGFDCTSAMNKALEDETRCKPTNVFILGKTKDKTDLNAVIDVCNGVGISMGHNTFQSKETFRIVKCGVKNPEAAPPRCQYKGKEKETKVTLGCNRNLPTHFDKAQRNNQEL